MFIIRFLLMLVVTISVVFTGLVFYVDYKLEIRNYSQSYNSCHKVWSARGLYANKAEQNSIKSINTAFKAGAKGVEIDVYYDIDIKDFIVSHDYPYKKINGEVLLLRQLILSLDKEHYFWLDFKRLNHLNKQQTKNAIETLFEMSSDLGVTDNLYIEGENPLKIAEYQKAGLHTMLDSHPVPESYAYLSAFVINFYKLFFYFGDHHVLSLPYAKKGDPIYGEKTRERLKNVPVFLYHTPTDTNLIKELVALTNVRVVLVGRDESVNKFEINNCN